MPYSAHQSSEFIIAKKNRQTGWESPISRIHTEDRKVAQGDKQPSTGVGSVRGVACCNARKSSGPPAARPIFRRLTQEFPRVRGHVFGAFRKCSADVHEL